MAILSKDNQMKKLQMLFSWSQFYENSESLSVPRYPRHYEWINGKRVALMPESDIKNHAKTQEQIINIGTK